MPKLNLVTKISNNFDSIRNIIILNDDRIALLSNDGNIIILNQNTLKIDIIISNTEKVSSNSFIQTKNGNIVTCFDKNINIYKIIDKDYKLIQTLKNHTDKVNHVREISSGDLVSCSHDSKLNFYKYINGKYEFNYSFTMEHEEWIINIIETRCNELVLCCTGGDDESSCNLCLIYLFKIKEKQIKKIGKFIEDGSVLETFSMISNNILAFCHIKDIILFDINKEYKIIKKIPIEMEDDEIEEIVCILNYDKEHFLIICRRKDLFLWEFKYENDKMTLKENNIYESIHENDVYCIIKDKKKRLISGGDGMIKIWELQ